MIVPKLDTLQKIELAEGVQVHLRPAGPAVRSLALILDLIFLFVGMLLVGFISSKVMEMLGEDVGKGVLTLAFFVLYWGYFILFEIFRRGQTPGKKIMNLRVVQSSGARVRWGPSMMRNLIRMADMMPVLPGTGGWLGFYLFGVTSCLATRRFQRLGDLVADTLVIYDRSDERLDTARLRNPVAPERPPVVLTREEQQAFTQFIERAAMWSDARKEEMVAPLAEVIGETERERVHRALAIGAWVRDS